MGDNRISPVQTMTLRLAEIHALACRFVPEDAASWHLYHEGARSWWPAHEIGHFLIATRRECRQLEFGLASSHGTRLSWRYRSTRELAATSISQRLLRHAGHTRLADEEIQYTCPDTLTLASRRWYKDAIRALLTEHRVMRLPTTGEGLEKLLKRKAHAVGLPQSLGPQHAERSRP